MSVTKGWVWPSTLDCHGPAPARQRWAPITDPVAIRNGARLMDQSIMFALRRGRQDTFESALARCCRRASTASCWTSPAAHPATHDDRLAALAAVPARGSRHAPALPSSDKPGLSPHLRTVAAPGTLAAAQRLQSSLRCGTIGRPRSRVHGSFGRLRRRQHVARLVQPAGASTVTVLLDRADGASIRRPAGSRGVQNKVTWQTPRPGPDRPAARSEPAQQRRITL